MTLIQHLYFFQHMNELHSLTDSYESRKRKGPTLFPLDASRLLSGASSATATLKCASWNTPWWHHNTACDGLLIMANPPRGWCIIERQHPTGDRSPWRCCRRNPIIVALAVILIIYCWDPHELVTVGHTSGQKLDRKDLSSNICLCGETIAEKKPSGFNLADRWEPPFR